MEFIKISRPELVMMVFVDDKVARWKISHIIAKYFPDFTIYTAENGKQGLELFKENLPDIVIIDINMPKVDAIQMAKEIRNINVNTQFILLTEYCDIRFFVTSSEMGVSNYILRPIQLVELYAAIEKCIVEITQMDIYHLYEERVSEPRIYSRTEYPSE